MTMKTPAFLQLASMGYRRIFSRSLLQSSFVPCRIRVCKTSVEYSVSASASWRKREFYCTQAGQNLVDSVIIKTEAISEVETILGYSFKDRSVLVQAMTHRSVINAGPESVPVAFEDMAGQLVTVSRNNERLELLGDKVFGLLVAHSLYGRDDAISEGQMSIMSQSLVSRKKANSYCLYVTAVIILFPPNSQTPKL